MRHLGAAVTAALVGQAMHRAQEDREERAHKSTQSVRVSPPTETPTPFEFGARQARRWLERKGYDRASLHNYRPHKWMLNRKPKWIPGYSEAGRRALRATGISTRPPGWVR